MVLVRKANLKVKQITHRPIKMRKKGLVVPQNPGKLEKSPELTRVQEIKSSGPESDVCAASKGTGPQQAPSIIYHNTKIEAHTCRRSFAAALST